ncbi:MAG: hypothetical protein KJ550_09880 [Proteobacteria bacterium]|nr:hypothetical protein [Pseudomonadota bacterium]MBU4101458.1 hypothetical protein [Pseudomonadota bacterium]
MSRADPISPSHINPKNPVNPACPACPIGPEDRIGVAPADGTGVNPACPACPVGSLLSYWG